MEQNRELESFYYVQIAFRTIRRHWIFFIVSMLLCLGGAFFLNWYQQPLFEVGTTIIVNENHDNALDPTKEFMKTFSIFTPNSDIQKEILKIKAFKTINDALLKVNAEIGYYTTSSLRTQELYENLPYRIELDMQHVQPMGVQLQIIPTSATTFKLAVKSKPSSVELYNYTRNRAFTTTRFSVPPGEYVYGEKITSVFQSFRILKDTIALAAFPKNNSFGFSLNDLSTQTYSIQKTIVVEQISKDIQAANIRIKTPDPQRGIDFVNALTDTYLMRNLETKKNFAEKTLSYFNDQLDVIEDSLKIAEINLKDFRSNNKLLEIKSKAEIMFKELADLENQKAEIEAKNKYYKYILETIEKGKEASELLVPSSMGINDQVLTSVIEEYIKLDTERNNLILNKQTESPYFNSLTLKLANQKKIIKDNATYLINTNNIQLNEVSTRLEAKNQEVANLPKTEMQLVGIERKYKLNDNIFNYILAKKAEAQVAKASNILENEILEPARLTSPRAVYPNKLGNLIVGFLIGMLLPFLFFGIKQLFSDTISDNKSLQLLQQIPCLGEIALSSTKKSLPLIENPLSTAAESIRTIRSNLQYNLGNDQCKVLLFTSSNQAEGKTFVGQNIALALSMIEKKIVIIDLDLRKPNHYAFNVSEHTKGEGLSAYLQHAGNFSDILLQTEHKNISYIPAGAIPSNPAELIASKKLYELLEALKQQFDYILLDTPPIAIYADVLTLMKSVDLNIVVVRQNKTSRKSLGNSLQALLNKKTPNLCWVFNGVNSSI